MFACAYIRATFCTHLFSDRAIRVTTISRMLANEGNGGNGGNGGHHTRRPCVGEEHGARRGRRRHRQCKGVVAAKDCRERE